MNLLILNKNLFHFHRPHNTCFKRNGDSGIINRVGIKLQNSKTERTYMKVSEISIGGIMLFLATA